MSLLGKLVALANRPGTEAEGDAARAAAARRASQEGVRLIRLTNGQTLTAEPLDDVREELMGELARIADADRQKDELDA